MAPQTACGRLPGIDAASLDQIKLALAKYKAVQTNQAGAQGDAGKELTAFETVVSDLTRRRREIQIAADRIWPAKDPANRPVRVEFKLPPDKALA